MAASDAQALPTQMKGVVSQGGVAVLRELPVPVPAPHEILVRVRAASLNRADLVGLSLATGQPLGMEWAGEVAAVGADVTTLQPGDRVMCTGAGAYAEYAVTDHGRACRMPAGLGFEDATVLTLALQTQHDALVTRGELRAGQSVLVHGATSGGGLMGLQMARHLSAGVVIGSSTSADKRARLAGFGADLAIDPADPAWVESVRQATGGRGVDVVIDMVGGPRFNQVMEAAAIGGRIVNVGRLGGTNGDFDFNLHALKRLTYIGVTFRSRSVDEIRAVNARMLADLSPALAAGQLRLPIDARFPLAQAGEALARMASNQHFGKIVLTV